MNFLHKEAVLVEGKSVHVFREEMLAGAAHGKSHLNNEVFNFTDIKISVLLNEIILDYFFTLTTLVLFISWY